MNLSYYFLYPIAYFIGLLPYKVQFLIADIIRFLLHKVVRYRLSVVRENLSNAFPEKSEAELLVIERGFYSHLSDVFLETMSMASVTTAEIGRRMRYTNIEQIEQLTAGQSWIAAMAHYGSWEYTINYGLQSRHDAVLAVYRPLSDKGVDKYYRQTRQRFGVVPVPMGDITRELIRRTRAGESVAVALIADQTPPRFDSKEWFTFLNQDTQFFMGMEKLALRMHMPVAFLSIDKVKRGYYTAQFELIYDGQEPLEANELTKRYAQRLEQMIRRRPELWMWSHRRWKHHPSDSNAQQTESNDE